MVNKNIELADFLKDYSPKTKKRIRDHAPSFNISDLRIVCTDIDEVGTSFEPRHRIIYTVYFGDKYQGKYQKTLVFAKNHDLVTVIDDGWIERDLQH